MTPEEKRLLLADICTRLPYGVKCTTKLSSYNDAYIVKGVYEDNIYIDCPIYEEGDDMWMVESIVPYLRTMSSMTEEEKEELRQEHIKDEKLFAECLTKAANGDSSMRGKVVPHFAADWCNKNHFDYRGLIPMGLALEASKDMYVFKN